MNKYEVGSKVYYPAIGALGTVTAVINQGRGKAPWYEVFCKGRGVTYSVHELSLDPFRGQKEDRNLGTNSGDRSFIRALEASTVGKNPRIPSWFKPQPNAGIFTYQDLLELRARYHAR